jgi:hypothetical protein
VFLLLFYQFFLYLSQRQLVKRRRKRERGESLKVIRKRRGREGRRKEERPRHRRGAGALPRLPHT